MELCNILNKICQPFNANFLAQIAAIKAIDDHEHIKKSRELNSSERCRLQESLESLGMECI